MGNVTLDVFAARVDCHFTTASRLRAGHRMPGRHLLGRIVKAYFTNDHKAREEAHRIFTEGTPEEFGAFLRERVFGSDDEDAIAKGIHESTGSSAA